MELSLQIGQREKTVLWAFRRGVQERKKKVAFQGRGGKRLCGEVGSVLGLEKWMKFGQDRSGDGYFRQVIQPKRRQGGGEHQSRFLHGAQAGCSAGKVQAIAQGVLGQLGAGRRCLGSACCLVSGRSMKRL